MTRDVRARRLAAWTAVWAILGTLQLPAVARLHSPIEEDLACGETSVIVRHPTTQFEQVLPAQGDGHCAICHLQRAVSGARPGAVSAAMFFRRDTARRLVSPGVLVARAASIRLAGRH
jgi:hypothetical protein